ncbi:MAG TPA: ABC transporter substrate-binding protein [Mycobacteriales bacterium]|jgi:iron complex transport system substrate-binding protein|nr:ABC transporter substrate-binding protein [Mycobacteriales bacterium]
MRIVSLLPSATEILFAVGAGDDVAGVTFECDHPAEARTRRVVSTSALRPGMTPAEIDAEVRARIAAGEDLYRLDEGALRDLAPDLVVTQDLCAVCAVDVSSVDAAMTHLGCDGGVLTVDPQTLEAVIDSIVTIGEATGHPARAAELAADCRSRLAAVAAAVAGRPRRRVVVVEWTDPPFCAGHWVPDMVAAAGAQSVLGRPGADSVRIEWGEVAAAAPDVIVVAPCGFRLDGAERLAGEVVDAGVLPQDAEVWAVDADAAYVRPGPRLVDGVAALAAALHPGAVPPREDLVRRVR